MVIDAIDEFRLNRLLTCRRQVKYVSFSVSMQTEVNTKRTRSHNCLQQEPKATIDADYDLRCVASLGSTDYRLLGSD